MCEYAAVTHSDYAGSVGLARLVDALHPQHKHHPAVMICLQMKVTPQKPQVLASRSKVSWARKSFKGSATGRSPSSYHLCSSNISLLFAGRHSPCLSSFPSWCLWHSRPLSLFSGLRLVWRLKSSPRVSVSLPETERHAVLVLYSRWARVSADGRCCTRQSPCHFPSDARAAMGCKQNQPCCGELGRLKCALLLLSSFSSGSCTA